MKNIFFSIAVDGSSASGKTTGSKFISKKFNFKLLSSGKLYRYISYKIIKNNYAYQKDGNGLFHVHSFSKYGVITKRKRDEFEEYLYEIHEQYINEILAKETSKIIKSSLNFTDWKPNMELLKIGYNDIKVKYEELKNFQIGQLFLNYMLKKNSLEVVT